jgi:hypothetical protein
LVNDVATRWNSSYLAWSRLIHLKEWIKLLSNTLSISTDLDTKKDGKRLKQIMITDEEWDFLAILTDVLSTFAEATTELGGSKYVTSSLHARLIIEIMKILRTNLQDNQVINDEEEDAFNEEIQDEISIDINKPINTYGLIDEIKLILYTNLMKYYPTITTEVLIFSILDPRFKSLDFASLAQKSNTEQHLRKLFEQEKKEISNTLNTSDISGTSGTFSNTSGISNISGISGGLKRKTLMERLTKQSVIALDEVGEYLQLYEIPLQSNPLTWWNEKKDKFPILSNLAQKYLAVSATSTASGRLFSDAGNLLTNKRTCMKPKLFKKIMFLKRNANNFDTIYSTDK